jgi:hypothetical protein
MLPSCLLDLDLGRFLMGHPLARDAGGLVLGPDLLTQSRRVPA